MFASRARKHSVKLYCCPNTAVKAKSQLKIPRNRDQGDQKERVDVLGNNLIGVLEDLKNIQSAAVAWVVYYYEFLCKHIQIYSKTLFTMKKSIASVTSPPVHFWHLLLLCI